MGEETDGVRVWLVERTFTEKPSLINHVYATTDGEQYFLRERSIAGSTGRESTTAAVEVDASDLTTVEDDDVREQYAAEAGRMASVHTPDDRI